MQMLIERLNPVLNPPNKAENPNLNGCPELISRDPVPGSSAEARTEIIEILSKKDNE